MVKNYWDKIKKQPTYLYGGGWEVRYEYCEHRKQMIFIWPSFEGIKRVEKTKIKNEVKLQLLKLKILSQASSNRDEYLDLINRITDKEFNEILETKIRGFALGNYIRNNFLTDAQAHTLFWRS